MEDGRMSMEECRWKNVVVKWQIELLFFQEAQRATVWWKSVIKWKHKYGKSYIAVSNALVDGVIDVITDGGALLEILLMRNMLYWRVVGVES